MKASKVVGAVFTFILLGLIFWSALNYRYLLDYYALHYAPANPVAEKYSNELPLTDTGKLIFYGTFPKLDSKSDFNSDCKPGDNVLEFGCYYSGINRVYLLDIAEPNLKTMTGVGAAHEMLHAVYSRLSASEKNKINNLIEADYQKIKDPDLDARLASYAKSEPGNRDNELHSILATEYSGLSADLEAHYRDYLVNRLNVVNWHQANESYIKDKEAALASQKAKIETDKANLDSLDALMDSLKSSGRLAEYNALVPRQNNLVTALRSEIDAYNQNVAAYNDVIASINSHTYSSFDASQIK